MTSLKTASLRRKPGEVRDDTPHPIVNFAKWLFAAFVLASLLFAHGCHGDEDNELFAAFTQWVTR